MENYAIRRLQEQFITQVAAQVLFEEGVKYMEQEMDEIGGMEASTSKSIIFIMNNINKILGLNAEGIKCIVFLFHNSTLKNIRHYDDGGWWWVV